MSGTNQIPSLLKEALDAIGVASSVKDLEAVDNKFLSRKSGLLTTILKSLKDLPVEERKNLGAAANDARQKIEEAIKKAKEGLQAPAVDSSFDPTLPGICHRVGAIHPITRVIESICESFHGMGFTIARGPDIETDYYNFEALNFPPDHPARDMQDTFYLEGGLL